MTVCKCISLEGHRDLYRLGNRSLTAIRYREESLGTIVRPYAGGVGPGFLPSCWWVKDRTPLGHYISVHTKQEPIDALVQIWTEILQDTIGLLFRSMPQWC